MPTLKFIFIDFLLIWISNSQNIIYLNNLNEGENCRLSSTSNGVCRKIKDCKSEYQSYKRNLTTLKICKFSESLENDLICCPKTNPILTSSKFIEHSEPDFLDFKTCRNEYLEYREQMVYAKHFGEALISGKLPKNEANCNLLNELCLENLGTNELAMMHYHCTELTDGSYYISEARAKVHYGRLVGRGERSNMAAIGWTQFDGSVKYGCGGAILTERFIVTAAHCKHLNRKFPDTVRLGDRFLLAPLDDDIAQQLKIDKFIAHRDYVSRFRYNDIAMIKTVERMVFNKFVVPSCVSDFDMNKIESFNNWTVAGYGETEDRIASNVLYELKVYLTSNEECNHTFEYDRSLPKGILDSQFCVRSKIRGGQIPDTCYGDSGSPLQFRISHEVYHKDFNQTFLSTVYWTLNVLGIVSFGADCGFDVPSVYTKLSYYRDWMRDVVQNF